MSEEEWTDYEGGVIKKFMYVNRRGPYGTVYALESLEVVLIGAAFDQDVSMVFIDDGIFEIKKGQDTAEIGMKNFSPTYRALEMYDVEVVFGNGDTFSPATRLIFAENSRSRVIDLPGTTLLPGLIEAHAHLFLHPYSETLWDDQVLREARSYRTVRAVVHAEQTLMSGFTTLRDLGTEGAGWADVYVET